AGQPAVARRRGRRLRHRPLPPPHRAHRSLPMIGRLRGILVSVRDTTLCIEVGGVGYEVQMTPRDIVSLPGVGEEIVVHTHTHVREDDISLYGFAEEGDRDMFRILNTASGVGPKVAMALLGALSSQELTRAIVSNDPDTLTVAPGVDRKSTRLNSSHVKISYAVFCLKKKKTTDN